MGEAADTTFVERAREAVGRQEWLQAYDLLIDADARAPLTGPDLAFLADIAYAAGHLDVTIDSWERVHAEALRAGDSLSAGGAAVRVAMHLLFDTALMAPIRGWTKRAERLLEGHSETPVHAWLAVVRNYERLLSGDFQSARLWARQAVEIGMRCDPAAAAVGRLAEARSLILEGDVSHGLLLLNDAGVATVSGELDPLSTGIVYCELICALQALAQYDLAEEWTAAMEHWRRGQPVGSIHGRCRVHRAEILRLRGSFVEAEKEALQACEELHPYLRREFGWPLTELGRIRLRMGDVRAAEESFRAAHELGWDPQPGLALVHLAKGDVVLAAESIRDSLDHPLNIPSKELPPNTELRRAPLLEARVEIELAAGDLDAARAAVAELSRIAARFKSKGLAAAAALAHGRLWLAESDTPNARRNFAEAAHLWSEIGAPYEIAQARFGMAQAHRIEGNEQRAILEFQDALAGFKRVGAVIQAAEAAQACADGTRGDVAAREPKLQMDVTDVYRSIFHCEGEYWSVEFQGHAVRLRDVKGLRYLARLLTEPGREFHVLDLIAFERRPSEIESRTADPGLALSYSLDAGVLLDARAKQSYRRRLSEIDEDIEEAQARGDDGRIARAEAEREFLVRELSRAVGLGGRDRRVGSASERARASVTRAVRQAMSRIREHHPPLGEHLERAVRTGTYCVYLPDPRIPPSWTC